MNVQQAEDEFVAAYAKWQSEVWVKPQSLKAKLFLLPALEKAANALEHAQKDTQ